MVASRISGHTPNRLWIVMLSLAAMAALSAGPSRADDDGIDKAKADALELRMFESPPGKKAYACFVRRYDADHLAQHPKQKVGAMKVLMTAKVPSDENIHNYSFRLGVKFRHRPGDFDSSGDCGHVIAEDAGQEIRFDCGVDCNGGSIEVALSKDDQSAIVRLERVRIWQHNKPDDEADYSLVAGTDDKIFRLDRADTRQCASVVTDRKELAAMRHK